MDRCTARRLALSIALLAPLAALAQPAGVPPNSTPSSSAPSGSPAAGAPPADWQAANRDVVALVQAGRFADAEARAKAAQGLCPPEGPARVLCLSLLQENTGWAQSRAERFAEAETSYKGALAAREQAFAVNDPAIGDSMAALGFFYFDRQRWDDAATQLERAVENLGHAGVDRMPVLAAAYARLADAYRAQGRMNAAVTTAREAVETLTRRAGPDAAPTQVARATLTALLGDAGQGVEAMAQALAALAPETLPLDQRVRLTIDAVAAANALGRTEAVRPAFETTLSLVASWDETGDAKQRQSLVQLLLAGSDMALGRGDPDTALEYARRAKALIGDAPAGKVDARTSVALIQEARALLDQGQAEQAASLLTEAMALDASKDPNGKPPPAQMAWMVRALMDAGRLTEAQTRLAALRDSIAGQREEQSSFGASLLQLQAQLAERQGDPRAALAAIDQAVAILPEPGIGTQNAVQAVNVRRDAIRLRAVLGDLTGTAAALTALLDVQAKAQLPLVSQLETRILLAWFHAETRQIEPLRTQIAAVDAAMAGVEAQAPRSAAVLLTRLADLSLAIPGPQGAAGAMAFMERARLASERTGQSIRDAARTDILRGRILARLERGADAAGACREAEEALAGLNPGREAAWRDAVGCEARAELQLGQYGEAAGDVARLLEQVPPERKLERAEAMRLLAAAQTGQGEADAADRTLRMALDLIADVSPRRPALRAEIWGEITANLHQAGRDREARNAAVAQRQIGNDDNAGVPMAAQSLRHEALALLGLQQLDEAVTVLDRLDRLERLRGALLRIDPALLQEQDIVMARIELARGRFAAAAAVADRVITAYRALPTAPRAGLADALEVRADVHLALGEFVAAETARREAVTLRHSGSPEAVMARLGLARVIEARGDRVTAARERDAAVAALVRLRGPTHAQVALARLEQVPGLVESGKADQAGALIAACRAAGLVAPCEMASADVALRAGQWAEARTAATAALAALRDHGDSDRPELVAPLLVLGEAALAQDDDTVAQAAAAQLAPLLDRARLEERLRGALLQTRLRLRAGAPAEAEASGKAGLALIAPGLPGRFAAPLLAQTEATATALLAQGRGEEAAALWRAALARLDGWGGMPAVRGAAQRGLGTALLATPDTAGALQAFQLAEQSEAASKGAGSAAHLSAIAGVVHAALAAGQLPVARAKAEALAAFTTPEAARMLASLRAEIAEETGDNVSALLEWWRATSLAGEDGAGPEATALTLLHTARVALATGQRGRAEELVGQANKVLATPRAGSDAALAFLELAALLRADQADSADALAATQAWRDAVLKRFGEASIEALAPELAMARLDQRAGENADAAARISAALGQAERLRGRSSRLWARIAVLAADAAGRIGDDARAKALRAQAEKVLAL